MNLSRLRRDAQIFKKIMAKYAIGFDIGGTKIDAGLVKGNKILKRKIIPTPKTPKDFLAAVFSTVNEIMAVGVRGIGIGMAGVIDRQRGVILHSPNLPKLDGLKLRQALEKKFGLPVRIDNDARCFLRAEANFGAARNFKDAVGLILGTGIGSGIMIDGKIYYGAGAAGEAGYSIINAKLIFKNLLSFEDLVSKKGFLRLGIKDIPKLAELARRDDKKALKIFEITGAYLGIGLANVIDALNPEIIVLGGGISGASEFLLPSAQKLIKKLVLSPRAKNTSVVVSKLGDNAGIIGAVLLFKE